MGRGRPMNSQPRPLRYVTQASRREIWQRPAARWGVVDTPRLDRSQPNHRTFSSCRICIRRPARPECASVEADAGWDRFQDLHQLELKFRVQVRPGRLRQKAPGARRAGPEIR